MKQRGNIPEKTPPREKLEVNEGIRAVARKDVRHASAEEIEQALRG